MTAGQARVLRRRISSVNETALITAAARALETQRTNGCVRDPFAERLAGDRGLNMLRASYDSESLSLVVGLRTRMVDEIIMMATRHYHITSIISLGAGMDARPWRLPLPPHFRWLEVDLKPVLDYKAAILSREKLHCQLKRRALDVSRPTQLHTLFRAAETQTTLLLTEGLLTYLPAATVHAIGREAAAAGVRCWLTELTNSGAKPRNGDINARRAKDSLDGPSILVQMRDTGWSPLVQRSFATHGMLSAPYGRLAEAANVLSLARSALDMRAWEPNRQHDFSGVYLFGS